MSLSLTPVPRALLRDDVHARLRDAIVDGTLAPGEQLRDVELAERLGVSRTPVREALLELARAGLVTATPGRSTVVAPLALARHTPIELSAPTCIPVVTMSSIIATDGLALTLVGGPGALNADVAKAHACSGPYQTGIYDPTSP